MRRSQALFCPSIENVGTNRPRSRECRTRHPRQPPGRQGGTHPPTPAVLTGSHHFFPRQSSSAPLPFLPLGRSSLLTLVEDLPQAPIVFFCLLLGNVRHSSRSAQRGH